MDTKSRELRVRTRAVHAGEKPDPATGASAPNLVMSTTFVADPDTSFSVEHMGEDHPFFYTRWASLHSRFECTLMRVEPRRSHNSWSRIPR